MNYYQTYNASEAFIGIQEADDDNDMLLLTDHGIFYEFIPMDSFLGIDSKTIRDHQACFLDHQGR